MLDKKEVNAEIEIINNSNSGNRIRQKSIKEIISKYWSYYPLFIFFLSIATFLTYLKIHFQVPQFTSSIKVILKDAKSGGADAKILSEVLTPGKTNLANEVEILKSTTLMKRVVLKLGLNTIITFKGKFRNTELYNSTKLPIVTFSEIVDSSKSYFLAISIENKKIYCIFSGKKYLLNNNNKTTLPAFSIIANFESIAEIKKSQTYFVTWTPTNQMASMIASGINANQLNKDATIVLLTHNSEIPQKSQDILNQLAEEYDKYNIEQKNKSLDNSIKFVEERLYYLSKDLGGVEDSLSKYKERHDIINLESQSKDNTSKITDLKENMDGIVVKIMLCDMVSQYVNNSLRKYNLIPSSLGIQDLTLTELISNYNKDVLKREELLQTIPSGNLTLTTLESELDGLRLKVIEAIKNVKKAYNDHYKFYNTKLIAINEELKRIPIEQQSILEIEREQGIKEKLYTYLLERREETAIAKASAISNSNPIDSAISSGNISASSAVLFSMSVILGLGLPVLLIFIKEALNDKINTKEDIIKYSNIPVIGEISHSKTRNNAIFATNSRGILAEQFRLLRTNLQYFFPETEVSKGVILITSTMKGEGKTFVSMNLGSIIAVGGKKTILLEFDLRKPRVSKALGIKNEIGISSYLSGSYQIEDLITPIENIENLWILPSGPVPPNPSEILLSKKINKLFSELTQIFDYIIIDTPPIGIVSDARILSKYSDVNFYIIRQRYTLKNQMEFVDTLYTSKILNNMALIVNDVVNEGSNSYYGYGKENYIYGGYYGYAYGYGYNDEIDKLSWIKNLFNKKINL